MSSSNGKSSASKHLNEQKQLEIISKLGKPNPARKQPLACEFNVDEKATRRIWDKKADIEQHSSLMFFGKTATAFHASVGYFIRS